MVIFADWKTGLKSGVEPGVKPGVDFGRRKMLVRVLLGFPNVTNLGTGHKSFLVPLKNSLAHFNALGVFRVSKLELQATSTLVMRRTAM